MTEAEWLDCPGPLPMLAHLCADWNSRKALLLSVAVTRRFWDELPGAVREWLQRAEALAEEPVGGAEHDAALDALDDDYSDNTIGHILYEDPRPWQQKPSGGLYAVRLLLDADWDQSPEADDAEYHAECARQADLVREIWGNPFRPVPFAPAGRTPTIVAIARAVYEEQRFEDLPILADALEDAGCDRAALLEHLRSPGPHVRGCWALDLVLGKE